MVTSTSRDCIAIKNRANLKNARKERKAYWYMFATYQLGLKHVKATLYAFRMKDEPTPFDYML